LTRSHPFEGKLDALGSHKERSVRTLLAAIAGVLTLAAPEAAGQVAGGLAPEFARDLACASPDASIGLLAAVARTTAPSADILAALGAIAEDAAACEPIRNAAKELAISLAASVPAAPTVPVVPAVSAVPEASSAAASSSVVAEIRADPERATSLKFEVGPPPPNLTRGRGPAL
jgi:hypothetical protein